MVGVALDLNLEVEIPQNPKHTAPRQVTTEGNVCLRRFRQVGLAKKLGAFSGFHSRMEITGASILRKAAVRETWLVVRESALNTRIQKPKVSYHVFCWLRGPVQHHALGSRKIHTPFVSGFCVTALSGGNQKRLPQLPHSEHNKYR